MLCTLGHPFVDMKTFCWWICMNLDLLFFSLSLLSHLDTFVLLSG